MRFSVSEPEYIPNIADAPIPPNPPTAGNRSRLVPLVPDTSSVRDLVAPRDLARSLAQRWLRSPRGRAAPRFPNTLRTEQLTARAGQMGAGCQPLKRPRDRCLRERRTARIRPRLETVPGWSRWFPTPARCAILSRRGISHDLWPSGGSEVPEVVPHRASLIHCAPSSSREPTAPTAARFQQSKLHRSTTPSSHVATPPKITEESADHHGSPRCS